MVCLPLCIYIGNTNENDICKEVTFFCWEFCSSREADEMRCSLLLSENDIGKCMFYFKNSVEREPCK